MNNKYFDVRCQIFLILKVKSKFKSRIYHLDATVLKHAFHRAIHLPKSLKNEAISCIWMTIVGGVDILA